MGLGREGDTVKEQKTAMLCVSVCGGVWGGLVEVAGHGCVCAVCRGGGRGAQGGRGGGALAPGLFRFEALGAGGHGGELGPVLLALGGEGGGDGGVGR